MSAADDLRRIDAFVDLDDDQIDWLAGRARWVTVEAGEALFREGDAAAEMVAIVEGELRAQRETGPPDGRVVVRRAGAITGMLPSSRLTHSPMTVRASVRTRVACFSTGLFPEMLERIPVLRELLASIMVDRSREYTRHDEQRAKLISLGKLSAGLAHELNNPAAAIQRTAGQLERRLRDLSALARALLEPAATSAGLERLAGLAEAGGAAPADPVARADAVDAMAGWLDAQGVPDAWLAAETLVAAGVTQGELERVTREVPGAAIAPALRWLETDLDAQHLLATISEAARRVSELIQAIKSYSNMDRAPDQGAIDIHDGLRSTLAMLAPRLRQQEVAIKAEFDSSIPPIAGNPGELNQVWTNLLENALDAAPTGGEIVVRTRGDERYAVVQVIDNGAGIPAELQHRIFEPFFTTKDVGQGTGLGLDIVRRIVHAHRAEINVESTPGRTCVEVRLPASPSHAEAGR